MPKKPKIQDPVVLRCDTGAPQIARQKGTSLPCMYSHAECHTPKEKATRAPNIRFLTRGTGYRTAAEEKPRPSFLIQVGVAERRGPSGDLEQQAGLSEWSGTSWHGDYKQNSFLSATKPDHFCYSERGAVSLNVSVK